MTRLAGKLRAGGLSQEEIEAALLATNETRCDPPLAVEEVQRIAASIARYEPRRSASDWPQSVNLRVLAKHEPSPPSLIMEGLPAGYATGVFGHGGAGKSQIELHRAVCIASGRSFFGVTVRQRRVLFLSCEDRVDVLHWRLSRISKFEKLDLASLQGSLEIIDLVGHDSVLFASSRDDDPLTAAHDILKQRIRDYESEVVFLDGITDVFGGNENARSDVKRFINSLIALIPPDRGAVVLIGHVNKSVASSGGETSEGYSGSTGWHNSVRARWYLRPLRDEEDKLVLELQKSNLGEVGTQLEFEWNDEAHLFLGRLVERPSDADLAEQEGEERAGILRALRACAAKGLWVPAATTGRRTAYHVLKESDEFPETLHGRRAEVRRFWQHVEVLRHRGDIVEESHKTADYHRVRTLVAASGDTGNGEEIIARTLPRNPRDGDTGIARRGYRGARGGKTIRVNFSKRREGRG